jgi:hypothetical protein
MTDDRRPPRNYLGRGEQRRLFWTWMPLALVLLLVVGWLERTYLRRGDDDPGIEQVDTVVPFAESGVPDAVVIEAAPPEEFDTPAMELGAPARALAAVRDDTVFRDADREAWFGLWQTLRSTDAKTKLHRMRRAIAFLQDKAAVKKLFDVIGPRFANRAGGYTRILRLPDYRIGDGGSKVVFELVENNVLEQKIKAKEAAMTKDAEPAAKA